MAVERHGELLHCRAGRGERYNQPHDLPPDPGLRWDMGEDAADLPPPAWQREVDAAVASRSAAQVVIDVSEMGWLVGQDLGYLLRLQDRLQARQARLAVVASARVVRAVRALGLPLDVRAGE